MATAVDIFEPQHRTFYVPQFQVSIAGKKLSEGLLRDVMQVTYHDNVENIDGFELVVNNWDAGVKQPQPKYEPPSSAKNAGIFDPGQKLELRMGYMNEMVLMLTGVITALEPNFPEASYSTLSVRGLNVLHTLRTEQHTYSWPDDGSSGIRDSDIAVRLGNMPLQAGKAGLGIKVKTDPTEAKAETAETSVMMNNQYDIAFLLERARRHGYQVVLNEQSKSNPERYLFFGPGESKRVAPTYKLVWGKTLTSFKPKLDTGRLIASVTWRGWDRQNDQLIEHKANWDDPDGVPAGPERDRLKLILQAFGVRNEVRISPTPRTKAEAKQLARQTLTRQYQEMVTASGVTVGLPDLRAGSKVQIEVGNETKENSRYSGRYYVTSTTHIIGDGGYRTQFEARRDPADQQ
jgi:phage protein D